MPRGTPRGEAIVQLAARGIIKGYTDGNFYPTDTLPRAQIPILLIRALGWDTGQPVAAAPFTDLGGETPSSGAPSPSWRRAGAPGATVTAPSTQLAR